MKRSEMLNIIWESINEVENADVLLKRLEDAGMSPPLPKDPDGFSNGPAMWEPEDV